MVRFFRIFTFLFSAVILAASFRSTKNKARTVPFVALDLALLYLRIIKGWSGQAIHSVDHGHPSCLAVLGQPPIQLFAWIRSIPSPSPSYITLYKACRYHAGHFSEDQLAQNHQGRKLFVCAVTSTTSIHLHSVALLKLTSMTCRDNLNAYAVAGGKIARSCLRRRRSGAPKILRTHPPRHDLFVL